MMESAYQVVKVLGEGSFGKVYQFLDKETGREYALKKISVKGKQQRISCEREIKILEDLEDENVVRMIENWFSGDDLHIVLELCSESLRRVITRNGSEIGVSFIKSVSAQVVMGLGYIHRKGIMHRDLKPGNILITKDEVAKIADFGLSRYESERGKHSPVIGSIWYSSPELLLGSKQYSTAVDLWALGCIIAELYLGKPLFKGSSSINQLKKINKLFYPITKESMPEWIDLPDLKKIQLPFVATEREWDDLIPRFSRDLNGLNFALTFLKINPLNRQSCDSAIAHSFIADVIREKYPGTLATTEAGLAEMPGTPDVTATEMPPTQDAIALQTTATQFVPMPVPMGYAVPQVSMGPALVVPMINNGYGSFLPPVSMGYAMPQVSMGLGPAEPVYNMGHNPAMTLVHGGAPVMNYPAYNMTGPWM